MRKLLRKNQFIGVMGTGNLRKIWPIIKNLPGNLCGGLCRQRSIALFQGDYYFRQAVPLKNLPPIKKKLFVLTGNVKHLLAVCHTQKDTVVGLSQKYLEVSYNQLVQACCRI